MSSAPNTWTPAHNVDGCMRSRAISYSVNVHPQDLVFRKVEQINEGAYGWKQVPAHPKRSHMGRETIEREKRVNGKNVKLSPGVEHDCIRIVGRASGLYNHLPGL